MDLADGAKEGGRGVCVCGGGGGVPVTHHGKKILINHASINESTKAFLPDALILYSFLF